MSYPVRVTVQVEGGSALTDFKSLTITQELFTHHTFALDFSFEALGKALGLRPDVLYTQAHEKLSGKAITISWVSALPTDTGRRFEFKGLITETSIQTNADLTNYYHISGASPTFLLEDGSQSRSFVKQTVQQIFTTVLGDYAGNAFARQLKPRRQAVLPYVAQYDETNFNFLSRLAAQQGEWFYYDGTTLQLGLASGAAVPFQSNGVQNFTLTMNLQPGQLRGSTYNYRTHQQLQATATPPASGDAYSKFALQRSKEVFTHPHRVLADSVLTDTPKLQEAMDTLAAKQTSGLVALEGHGEAFDIKPGSLLDVRDAAGVDYGQFRVLAVAHELDGDGNYQNRFKGMSGALDSPPANEFYAPPAAHPEVAEVIDLTDPRRLGRVRVRFQWAVDKPADAESGWLRVTTPYSGDGKGHMFTPEVGSQVLVSYEHGLADLPVVVGNVFHPENKQGKLYSPPSNNLKGMQTAGGNKFVMSEIAGAQTILLSNSNNKDTAILVDFKGDGSITIRTNGPINLVSGDTITLEATKNIELRAGEDISIAAQKNISVAAREESISVRAQKELQLTAVSDDLTLQASSKKLVASAVDNLEITSSSVVKVSGQDVKLNNPG
ncbi:MAG: type VI secretion system Vgr family protein [Janthinobacterium lividum]